jgi:hypothetical protein
VVVNWVRRNRFVPFQRASGAAVMLLMIWAPLAQVVELDVQPNL